MSVKPLVVLVPEDLAARIQELAEQDGLPVSQWMAAAAQQMTEAEDRESRDAAWRQLMALLDEEYGPITEEERQQALEKWPD